MKFESSDHYFFYVRKILTNKGVDFPNEYLRPLTDAFYYMDSEGLTELYQHGLRDPKSVLTWKLRNVKFETFADASVMMSKLKVRYDDLIEGGNPYDEKFSDLFKENYDNEKAISITLTKKPVTDKFISDMKYLNNKPGVYFLYNTSNKLIYVGKSSDLGSRIPISAKERSAHRYAYSITETYSDAGIYEMYFISLYKPSKNVEGKHHDSPTVDLPEIETSNVRRIYKSAKKKVR